MRTIRSAVELRSAYWIINELKELGKTDGLIVEMKRAVRTFTNKPVDRRIVRDRGIDGYVELIELPDYITSMKDADEYFMGEEYIPTRHSAYDCTGARFTSWYKLVRRNGRFYAYHSVAVDI